MKCPDCTNELEKLAAALYRCKTDGLFIIVPQKSIEALEPLILNASREIQEHGFKVYHELEKGDNT